MNTYKRLQFTLHTERNKELVDHLEKVGREFPILSEAAVIKHIIERDRQVAKVYGAAWDWRNIVKPPPWLEKLMSADGRAKVIIEDVENVESKVVIDEGIFDE